MPANSTNPGLDSLAQTFGLAVITPNGDANTTSVPDGPVPIGSLSTIKNIYAGPADDQGRYTWVDKFPEHIVEAAENEETAGHALVVRNQQCFDSRKQLEIHSLIVQSPWLKKALAEILKDYPGVTCELERLVFKAPFEPFMHRWGDLLKFMKARHDEKTTEHVQLLHGILSVELKDTIRAFEDYMANGVITYEHLWIIFQPGSTVVSTHDGPLSAYEFQSASYVQTRCGKAYQLECQCIDWDGERFGRRRESIHLYEFKGTKPIKDLHGLPFAFHPDKVALRHRLVERGKKFEELAGFSRQRQRWVGDLKDSDHVTVIDTHVNGERGNQDYDFLVNRPKPRVRLSDSQHLICSPKLSGYALKSKKWRMPPFPRPLPSARSNTNKAYNQKDLVMSFAESQIQNHQTFDDVIQGKGKGIVMLLSGPPGVGKTLTAESVAENMHVPLYMMSAGDLGLRPENVEKNLTNILEMVEKWRAILLLDECDVFLEARSTHDLERNKLVSIFLRVLEYYEGILFLTTNRVGNIDPAFQSRIHVSIAYSNLTAESRRAIWSNLLESPGLRHEMEEGDLKELAEVKLNGRQIKNVLKTAQLLATKRGGILRRELVETVLAIERVRPQV
ncbi:MAG: hypothetical protein Q9187_003634 [Circinaria calcarea]